MMEKYMSLISKVDGQLTDHFSKSELNASGYAAKHGIRNVASGYAAENQLWLAIVLEIIREHEGVPITVTSGYRSYAVNKAVGGSRTSAHQHGSAADIKISGIAPNLAAQKQKAYEIKNYFDEIGLIYDQIIYYKSWIHIGMRFRSAGRKQIFKG